MISMLLCLALLTAVLPGAFAAEEETAAGKALTEEDIANLGQMTDKTDSGVVLSSSPVSFCQASPARRGIGNVNQVWFNLNAYEQTGVVGRELIIEYLIHAEKGADNAFVEFHLYRGSCDADSTFTAENHIYDYTYDATDLSGDYNTGIRVSTGNLPAGDYTLTMATVDRDGNLAGESRWKTTFHLSDYEIPLEDLYFFDLPTETYIGPDLVIDQGGGTTFCVEFVPVNTTINRKTKVSSLDTSIVQVINRGGNIEVYGISNGTADIVLEIGDLEFRQKVIVGTGSPVDDGKCHGGVNCPSLTFSDICSDDWFHPYVDYVVSHHLMGGTSDYTFEPESPMTRSMLVTVLWRFEGEPHEGSNIFVDVPGGQWFTDAIAWAALNQIVGGVGNSQFDPEGNITREQMATILYRYAQKKGFSISARADLSVFPDAGNVSGWAQDAMQWAVGMGYIGGSDGFLLPGGNATRAQVAAILQRFITSLYN